MRIDTERIKQETDIRQLAAKLTTLSGDNRKSQSGPCPRCSGDDRFVAYREKFLCRQCHPSYGDCFHFAAWLNDYNLNTRAGMEAAADWLTNGNPPMVAGACSPKPTTPRPRPILTPPAESWQQRAADFVAYAQEQLWTEPGRVGLDYLLGRGLSEETIKAAGLGFNPKDYNDPAHKWGVSGRDSIWLPGPGIAIPWAIDGSLHRVNIRLLEPQGLRSYYVKQR